MIREVLALLVLFETRLVSSAPSIFQIASDVTILTDNDLYGTLTFYVATKLNVMISRSNCECFQTTLQHEQPLLFFFPSLRHTIRPSHPVISSVKTFGPLIDLDKCSIEA